MKSITEVIYDNCKEFMPNKSYQQWLDTANSNPEYKRFLDALVKSHHEWGLYFLSTNSGEGCSPQTPSQTAPDALGSTIEEKS